MQISRFALRLPRLVVLSIAFLTPFLSALLRPQRLQARTIAPLTRVTLESMAGDKPRLDTPEAPEPAVPTVATTESLSIGEPNRGRLINGVEVKTDDRLLVRSDENFGTAETVDALRRVVDAVYTRFPGTHKLVVGDLSKEHGGRIRPHKSHQSGRDIDLGFFLSGDARPNLFVPVSAKNLDFERTLALIDAIAADDTAQYVFIDRRVQKLLYDYAIEVQKRTPASMAGLFEYPRRGSLTTLVRHRRGHSNHLHIRFFSPQAVAAGEKFGGEALAQMGAKLDPFQRVRFTHVIRKGDTLARVAQRYRLDLTNVMKWNGLKRRSTLQVGQGLALYRTVKVPEGRTSASGTCHAGPRAIGCWHPSRS
jgi:murein endopeptidase